MDKTEILSRALESLEVVIGDTCYLALRDNKYWKARSLARLLDDEIKRLIEDES